MTRRRIATLLVLGVLASGGATLALSIGSAQAQCLSQISSGFTYGGQGTQISQPCEPKAAATLPFTGLDLGLLVAAGLVLIAGGIVLRLRLRHGGQ
jgi:hypothetical protein